MPPRFKDIGDRLKAYRLGAQLTADDVAKKLGLSRAAVYRIEAGDVVKIETLEKLAGILDTSTASLLGVSIEYYGSAIAYFERMRQLESEADQIVAHFPPFSFLLTSDDYSAHLKTMLLESQASGAEQSRDASKEIVDLVDILTERKRTWRQRRLSVVNFITIPEIDRFLQLGAIGRFGLPAEVVEQRRAIARAEVENVLKILIEEPMGIQIAIVEEPLPNITFQLFRSTEKTSLALSPFRLGGELPNISAGVAMLTAAEEPVRLYEKIADDLWKKAHKGARAADALQAALDRSGVRRKPARKAS
jgi:transcriptional regulator with XRE-family HTH domain